MEVELIRVGMKEKDRMGFLLEFHDSMRLAGRFNKIGWSQDNINLFNKKIDNLRLSCTRPWYVDSSNLDHFNMFYKGNRIQVINSELRYDMVECSICCDDLIDSVTRCGHFFCYDCIYKILIDGHPCPNCRRSLHPFHQVSRMSNKLDKVRSKICLSVRYDYLRRVVVLCSCVGSLKSLKGGLVGSGLDPVICDDTMEPGEVIQSFLNSDKNILLLPLKALIREIILPHHSIVLIVDTVVPNVRNYIFQKIKTVGEDTLSKAMYVTDYTIEEFIAVEREYEDEYDMIDADGNFAGQVFQRQYRSIALLKSTQDLMLQTDYPLFVPFEDPGEEAEQDAIF